MKNFLIIASLAAGFISCNNSDTASTTTDHDTSNHTAHQSDVNNSAGGQNHMKAMHDAMNNMMQQMQSMKPTGDPDHDFAMMMKHHHQGAIDMAKAEVSGGSDETLKQMAQKMIDKQQQENAEFDRIMQTHQPSRNSDFGQKAMSMMTPMSDIKMEGGSLDAMFASMMIPHHQDAVKMAQEYLKVGKNEELKTIAKDIIQSQPQEIDQLKRWMNNNNA